MSTPKAIRTTLITLAVIAITTVFIAIACAPASPGPQTKAATPEPTTPTEPTSPPTNTPETIWITNSLGTEVPAKLPPRPLTPYPLHTGLQARMTEFEATKEAHQQSGLSMDNVEDEVLHIAVYVDSAEKVDRLVAWLNERPDRTYIEVISKEPDHFAVATQITTSLLKELSELKWISSVKNIGLSSSDAGRTTPPQAPNDDQAITAWHNQGITGTELLHRSPRNRAFLMPSPSTPGPSE